MTDQQQPIDLPSYKLVQELMHESGFDIAHPDEEALFPASKYMKLAARFIRHGADQELEKCCEWVSMHHGPEPRLRAARRPKPPSLKEQALEQLGCIQTDLNKFGMGIRTDTIRRALEALPE